MPAITSKRLRNKKPHIGNSIRIGLRLQLTFHVLTDFMTVTHTTFLVSGYPSAQVDKVGKKAHALREHEARGAGFLAMRGENSRMSRVLSQCAQLTTWDSWPTTLKCISEEHVDHKPKRDNTENPILRLNQSTGYITPTLGTTASSHGTPASVIFLSISLTLSGTERTASHHMLFSAIWIPGGHSLEC